MVLQLQNPEVFLTLAKTLLNSMIIRQDSSRILEFCVHTSNTMYNSLTFSRIKDPRSVSLLIGTKSSYKDSPSGAAPSVPVQFQPVTLKFSTSFAMQFVPYLHFFCNSSHITGYNSWTIIDNQFFFSTFCLYVHTCFH